MSPMKTSRKRNYQRSAIGIRPREEIRTLLEHRATEDKRTVANVCVYIIDKVLSITNGSLDFEVIPSQDRAA